MLRPIESSMSLYNVEQKASQTKDPNAHVFQSMQQDEIVKRAQHQAQSVQPTEKTEGEVKVRERKDERDKDGRRKKRSGLLRADAGQEEEAPPSEQPKDARGGLNFLA